MKLHQWKLFTFYLLFSYLFMHLADALIQSDLVYSGYTFFVSMCSLGIEPTTFALLTQCSTTEPQEHKSYACYGGHF